MQVLNSGRDGKVLRQADVPIIVRGATTLNSCWKHRNRPQPRYQYSSSFAYHSLSVQRRLLCLPTTLLCHWAGTRLKLKAKLVVSYSKYLSSNIVVFKYNLFCVVLVSPMISKEDRNSHNQLQKHQSTLYQRNRC